MKTAATFWPYHTKNWIFLAQLTSLFAEQKKQAKQITQDQANQLLEESDSYFEKAKQLSPKHQETYIEWTKSYIASRNYQEALQKAQECIAIDPRTNDCWWLKGLTGIYLGNLLQSQKDLNSAYQRGLLPNTTDALSKLADAYAASKQYAELVKIYEQLIQRDAKNTQYHASLATVYKELGQLQKAKAEALKVLELNPQSKDEVHAFLQSLGQ